MKKYIFAAFALMMAAAGCQKPDGIEEFAAEARENILTATMNADTRTMLGDKDDSQYANLWSEGDRIAVFLDGAGQKLDYDLKEGAGTPKATFTGTGSADSYVAVYPASAAEAIAGNTLSLELPAEQTYAESSFGPDSFPMVAVSDTPELTFRNLCAVLKVVMTGTGTVQSIRFTARDESIFVAGKASADISDPAAPKLTMAEGGTNSVILNCTGGGVELDEQTPAAFHIVIPAQTYTGGFTLTIATPSGTMEKVIETDVEMSRSQLRAVKQFEFEVNTGIEASKSLSGEGTSSSPFLIQSIGDLMLMQQKVNTSGGKILSADSGSEVAANSAYYKQTADIDMANYNNAYESWTPIGDYATSTSNIFRGTYDGDGHSITNLYINSESRYQGLFGYCSLVTIKSLTVSGDVTGDYYTAILAGYTYMSSVTDCKTFGVIRTSKGYYIGALIGYSSYTTISECSNYAEVNGYIITGGLVGYGWQSSLYNCTNQGEVKSNVGSITGGIVGYANTTDIYNCSNSGNLTGWMNFGGIAGSGNGTTNNKIANCYNSGEMNILNYFNTASIGGIVGDNAEVTVANCVNVGYFSGSTTKTAQIGGIVGKNSSTVENCYWLSTSDTINGIGTDEGSSAFVIPLNDEQVKNNASANIGLYYSTVDNTYYTNLVDALNAWAAENEAPSGGVYSGWQTGEAHPVFTFEQAVKPEGSDAAFSHSFGVKHNLTTFARPVITGPYLNATISWGDAQEEDYDSAEQTHTYTSAGEHTVTVSADNAQSFKLADIKGISELYLK